MSRFTFTFPKPLRSFGHSVWDLMRSTPLYRRTALLSALFVLLTLLLPLWRILPLATDRPFIPLHYNVHFGIDQFGPWYDIFRIPALGLALFIVNIFFQAAFYRREHVLSKFFAIATVVSEFILFVAMVLIVLLNL